MAAVSRDAVNWALSPSDDQSFDSAFMGHPTVVDSDYVAYQIWAHENLKFLLHLITYLVSF